MEGESQELYMCGKFQILQVSLVQSCRFVFVWALFLMAFGLYNPGWRCIPHDVKETQTWNASSLATPPPSSISPKANGIPIPGSLPLSQTYDLNEDIGSTNSSYVGSCNIIKSCKEVIFNQEASTVVSQFGLICDKAWIGYLMVSLLNCGMLAGTLVWGQIGERYGRKAALYGSTLTMTIGCGLAVLSPVWEVYAFFTFIIGFGVVGVVSTVNILCLEFLTSKWRARLSSIPIFNISFVSFAVTIYLIKDWKYIHLVTALICFMSCLGFFWTAESLRWLIIHKKLTISTKIVQRISKLNKRDIQPESLHMLSTVDKHEGADRHYTYADLFGTSEIRSLTIKLCAVWSISVFTYETIGFGIQSLPGNFYVNLIVSSAIECPVVLLVGPLANKLGRRRSGILFLMADILCCAVIVISLVTMEKSGFRDNLVTFVAVFHKLSSSTHLTLVILYMAELMPTSVRNLASGVFNIPGRVVGIVGSYIIPRDDPSLIACFAALMGLQLLVTVIYTTLAETNDRPLPDTMKSMERRPKC